MSRIFSDKEKLALMFLYREKGLSHGTLARIFMVDRTAIIFHCKKNNIQKKASPSFKQDRDLTRELIELVESMSPQDRTRDKYAHLIFENVNNGKRSYADYCRAAGIRPPRFH